ncbi:hypothetical protein JCM9279_006342 [Rhodotorula babjevae]
MANDRPPARRPRPSRAQPPPPPRRPPPALVLLAHLTSTLPLWFNSAATDLLAPLYSHQPTHALKPTLAFYAACTLAFAVLVLVRKRRPHVGWRAAWLVIGAYKVVTEGLLRWNGGKLVTRPGSLDEGVVAARIALELVPTVATWAWLVESASCVERKAFLSPAFLPLAYLVSVAPPVTTFLRSRLPIVPECYILQPHGLALCALALLAPRTLLPPQRQPRARPHAPPRPSLLDRLAPSPLARLFLLALVALAAHRVAQTSAHCPTSPASALPAGVLAARKSVTGWITVGEHALALPDGAGGGPSAGAGRAPDTTFRFLRADHSLLGGLWAGPSRDELRRVRKRDGRGGEPDEREVVRRAESIYSTFILQELVRLVPAPVDLPRQSPEQGLIIGLGAGLSARALAQHGVNLTLVELDPAVYEFARDYFGVGEDVQAGEVVLEDAVRWVERQDGDKLFDYIIHDVFTGGAVPTQLFLLPFLSHLGALLHPSGVVALNFAGSLSPASPASRAILGTVLGAFKATGGHCRAIEDVPRTHDAPPPPPARDGDYDEIRNVVVFCSRSWFVPIAFRAVERGDLLEWPSPGIRRSVFRDFEGQEVDLGPFRVAPGEAGVLMRDERDARRVEGEQLGEVRRHWEAMRGVLPAEVWARW